MFFKAPIYITQIYVYLYIGTIQFLCRFQVRPRLFEVAFANVRATEVIICFWIVRIEFDSGNKCGDRLIICRYFRVNNPKLIKCSRIFWVEVNCSL